jgi:hypothetical protein
MARASVTIDSGELPSAIGVKEGNALFHVISRWQRIAFREFRENCQALKQMIEETDALRLWEKNVGGFTFKDRDDFLRNKVLIDYDLTERDMTEIVALLKHDEPSAVATRLAAKMRATPALAENGALGRGRTRFDHVKASGGNSSAYLAARIKRDRPDIAAAVERGEFRSMRAAAIAAGIVKSTSALKMLRRAWNNATPAERATFLDEVKS